MPNIYNKYIDLHFKLMADITTPVDFSIRRFGPGYSTYNHVFDGNGYKITLFNNLGVFNIIENGSVINLSVDGEVFGSNIEGGGIAALSNNGTIENCNNYATITGNYAVGGIVGRNNGRVVNCFNFAKIVCQATYAGGIAGMNTNYIGYCANIGNVTNTGGYAGGITGKFSMGTTVNVEYCINVGSIVSSNLAAGGIVGWNNIDMPTIVANCINYGLVSGNTFSAGIIGIRSKPVYTDVPPVVNCINTGVILEGKNGTSAILCNAQSAFSELINCYYDKQMCIYGAASQYGSTSVGVDIPGQATGRLTRNMVGRKLASLLGDTDWTYVEGATLIESLYPQLKVFSESNDERRTDASKVGATPIFLYDGIDD